MARPERNNVDYFPFLCEEGNKMFYIEQTYGNDGFATFVKLLRELARTDYHYLNLSKPSTVMYLSSKCSVSKNVLEAIIDDLVELGKFDESLWRENKIIWCQDFIDSIQDAYKKRNNSCITLDGLLHLLDSLGVRKLSKLPSKPGLRTLKGSRNPQKKEEERKEDFNYRNELLALVPNVVLVDDFIQQRINKNSSLTKTAFDALISECQSHNFSLEEALKIVILKNWQGFKMEWVINAGLLPAGTVQPAQGYKPTNQRQPNYDD